LHYSKILKFIPEHTYYIEPFGGGASVLLAKDVRCDIYNDINSDVVNFFRVLRDKEKFDRFIHYVALTPVSREEFYRIKNEYDTETDDVMKAYMFYYLYKLGFSGMGRTFGIAVTETAGQGLNRL